LLLRKNKKAKTKRRFKTPVETQPAKIKPSKSKDTMQASFKGGDTALSRYLTHEIFLNKSSEIKKGIYGYEVVKYKYKVSLDKNDIVTDVFQTVPPPLSQKYIDQVSRIIVDAILKSSKVNNLKNWSTKSFGKLKYISELNYQIQVWKDTVIAISMDNKQITNLSEVNMVIPSESVVRDTDKSLYTSPASSIQEPEVFSYVDEMPVFDQGEQDAFKYIYSKIKYPQSAEDKGIQGKCFVKFIIGKDGKVRDVNITKGVMDCKECDEEAKRVISNMPLWNSGKNGGKAVDVYYTLPVKFSLENNGK
jgi:TonB family protein